ncbi:MAG: PAS domain S-box protein, partial [Alphaproteobacteria bacterium]
QCDVTEATLAAQAQEKSERDLQNLFRDIPDFVSRARPDTTLTFVNDAYARFQRAVPADLIGRKFLDLVEEPHREELRKRLTRLTPGSPMETNEERRLLADGSEQCLLWTNLMIYEDGEPVELICVGRDITAQDVARRTIEAQSRELELSNEALRTSEERFQLAVQGGSVGIWDWRIGEDGAQLWSDKLLEMLGLEPGEIEHTLDAFAALVHPDDRDATLAHLHHHLETGDKYECEFRMRHKSGAYRWFLDTGEVSRDAAGKPTRMVGTMIDIHDRKVAEANLKRSEERFRSLYNDTPMMLHSVDSQRRLVAVSDYWLEQMGYVRDEVIGRPVLSFMTAASRAEFLRSGAPQLDATGQIRDFPHQLERKDGSLMDCLLSAVRTRNEAGEIEQTLAVAIDVTEKRQIEEALARQQRELQLIFDHAPVRIWYKDDQNRVLRLNKRAAQAIGMMIASSEGSGLADHDPQAAHRHFTQDMEVIRSGKPMLGVVEQVTTAEGRIEWTRTDRVPYLDPETGRTQMLATATDITEQKIAELELARQQRELQLIFDNVPVKIFYKDDSNRILRVNRRAAESLGLTAEQIEGASAYDLFPGEAGKYYVEDLEVIASGQAKLGIIEEYVTAHGRGWVSTDKVPYTDPDTGERNILVTATDITALKNAQLIMSEQAEALQRSNEELEQFAYVASHDLKAPLRGIDNLASWIEEDMADRMDAESRANMALLRGRVARLEELLNGLLQYSRIGRSKSDVDTVDLAETAAEVFDLVRGERRFALRCEPLPTLATGLVPLQLVLRNLISNAIKHHDRTEGTITVSARDLGEQYEITVADDGPGIDPAFHARIFGMFQVLRPRDQVEGSGLGLAIIEKQLRTLGCGIRVESDPARGRGTTFRFSWPKRWPFGGATAAAA